ncbi:MAG TPA: hypothetical protein PLZ99_00900 [Parcubacteria group bacterium]|jgi:hypothetical protein|nr:hypothetical protein [Parcubacteria group bacterium]
MEKYSLEKAQEEASKIQKKIESGKADIYEDAHDQVEGEKPITKEMLSSKIADLGAIEQFRDKTIRYREEIAGLVERPLLSACEELYDKNIITLGTSANAKDVEFDDWKNPGQKIPGEGAYIIIDFDTLSPKNQEIGRSLGKIYFVDDMNKLKIALPLTKETTFEDVQKWSLGIAHKFVKQQYKPKVYTLESLRQAYGYDPEDESVKPENFSDYYWSPEYEVFFLSKEQHDKAVELINED